MADEDFKDLSDEEKNNLLKLQKDARAGKINPYDDGKRILDMVNKAWERQGFVGPFSESIEKGLADLRKACEILDKGCIQNAKEISDTLLQEAIQYCRAAMIGVAFEFTPPAEFIRAISSKIVEGPKVGWR